MKERFEGEEGRRRALEVLHRNPAVLGATALASELYKVGLLEDFFTGDILMRQGEFEVNIAFILSGQVEIFINDRSVARREAPSHVGEMAAIDPKEARSATVKVLTPSVVMWIKDEDLTRVAESFPALWRGFARELADRLRQREKFHSKPNLKPRMFIGSSVENLDVARAIQLTMDHDPLDIQPWMVRTFRPSHFTIPDLLVQVERCDFAVFCLSPDDILTSRDKSTKAPRDNVLFEAGLFMGRLGYERVFVVKPRGVELKLPSDLAGFSPLEYRLPEPGDDVSVETVCEEIRRVIKRLGPR